MSRTHARPTASAAAAAAAAVFVAAPFAFALLAMAPWRLVLAQPVERKTTESSPTSGGTTKPTADVEAEIDALLVQLASEEWSARKAAQERLVALAGSAEPRLQRAARESGDPEVRTRCDAALQQIAEGRLIGPSLITLRLADAPPRVAFEELGKQVGFDLKPQNSSIWNQALPAVSIDVERVPFWEVVRQLREQCGLDVDAIGMSGLTVMPPAPRASRVPTCVHGPFRIRAMRLSRQIALDLATGNKPSNDFAVVLSVTAEPKLRITSAAGLARLDAAEDENGASLLPIGAGAAMINAGAAGGAIAVGPAGVLRGRAAAGDLTLRANSASWPVNVRLHYPDDAGERVARLRGSTTCTVSIGLVKVEIPDILNASGVTEEVAGAPVTIQHCRKVNDAQYEVSIVMSRNRPDLQNAITMTRGGTNDTLRMIDADGREMTRSTSRMRIVNGQIEMTLSFRPTGAAAPSKLVWQVPSEVRDLDVAFDFKDLPMP